jgi:hypothetical protein
VRKVAELPEYKVQLSKGTLVLPIVEKIYTLDGQFIPTSKLPIKSIIDCILDGGAIKMTEHLDGLSAV